MLHTHVTAPTRFAESGQIRFAYRRFGQESGIPLLFFQHFRGGMDHWDPAVTDGFAQDRPVVLFDNAGVAGTTGDTPNTIEAIGTNGRGTLILRVRRRRWELNEQRRLNGARYEENAFQNSRTFRNRPCS